MSFAVATTNTRLFFSASQVRKLQNVGRLGEAALRWSDIDIKTLETIGDRPLKERQTCARGGLYRRRTGLPPRRVENPTTIQPNIGLAVG